ncbi:MAG: DUF805 domain-containing protein [Stenotrophobium sp.]
MNWYLDVLQKHYADFNGRAHRQAFWMFALINLGITIVVNVVASIIHLHLLSILYALALLLPSLALGARRLHDTNRSGWWLLIGLVPLVGVIVLIVFCIQDSDPGDNQFGPSPKAAI